MAIARVRPASIAIVAPPPLAHRRRCRRAQAFRILIRLSHAYNWGLWTLVTVLLFAQFFGVLWTTVTTNSHFLWGQSPSLGKFAIPGSNDEPYADRAVVCVKRSEYYRPIQLTQLLQERASIPQSSRRKSTTNGADGYRVVSRDSFTMDASSISSYVRQCDTLVSALGNIFAACEAVGYNVTRDTLRVVDGVESNSVTVLESTLPVLIVPYWDLGALSRYIIPGKDGSACMFRGGGVFESEGAPAAIVQLVDRQVREAKTEEWLEYPGGVWRNGWYEDPIVNMRWYSDVISSIPNGEYGIAMRQFQVHDGLHEDDCSTPPYGCTAGVSTWSWSDQLKMKVRLKWMESIAISNGRRYGLFWFDALHSQKITSHYSLEKLLSNVSFAVLLSRWMVAMVALSPLDTIGIGAVSSMRSFHLLPLFLVARLKSTLVGFWSAGCEFEGDQRALADAWFDIYPAIGELVFLLFSVLNSIAKILRRRTSDAMFGPTLLAFVLLHYFRAEIAAADFLEFDKRISTAVTADELERASVLDFFVTSLAFRVNGKATSLFSLKLAILALNLMPLALFSRHAGVSDRDGCDELHVERALAVDFGSNAGLGSSKSPYMAVSATKAKTLRPYELVRAGYVTIASLSPRRPTRKASSVLLSMSDWFWLAATHTNLFGTAPTVAFRIVVFGFEEPGRGKPRDALVVSASPRLLSVTDKELAEVIPWRVGASALS